MSDSENIVEDVFTGDVTLVGATRGVRPNEYRDGEAERCAFCPGHESETPPELASYRDAKGTWETRAFRNRYPAIEPPDGEHEVIVDSPHHEEEITISGVRMWFERYSSAVERLPRSTPVLFKNCGLYAGATLVHPHTQLMILNREVPRWSAIVERGCRYRAERGTCVWCDELRQADADDRLVFKGTFFAGYVREGARFGWSLTILPLVCGASPRGISGAECAELGTHLIRIVDAIRMEMTSRTAFNVTLVAEPRASKADFHWWIEVIPRLGTLAGFELATGMFIKSARAKESAWRWRRRLAVHYGPF